MDAGIIRRAWVRCGFQIVMNTIMDGMYLYEVDGAKLQAEHDIF
jgi:hypothetical protein